MNKKQMKVAGIVCLIVCAICLVVAIERYNTNANNVRAANALVGQMFGEMTPATPTSTKVSGFLALAFGVGGIVLLVKSKP